MTFWEFAQDCSEGVFQKTMLVICEQADAYGRMRPSALARQMGDATAEHMALMGLDFDMLQSHGLMWVLARTALQVKRLPRHGEVVLLRAWAGKEKHWTYPRRSAIFSATGEQLVSACSQWMLIDANTRKLAPPSELLGAIPIVSLAGEAKPPPMQVPFPEELPHQAERAVQPSEIDLNGHVNNSFYLDWATELLDAMYQQEHTLSSFWVEYCHELFAGQSVSLRYKQEGDTFFVRGDVEGEESFSLRLDY